MKPLSQLDDRERTARLRRMAEMALAQYDLDVVSIRPLAMHFNAIFRVDTRDRARFVLGINRPGHRTLTDIASELSWLDALRRDTDLQVVAPRRASGGSLVVTVAAPGIPEPRHCALFEWIGGRSQIRRPSRQTLVRMGEALARLHDHADTFTPPDGFTTKRLDRVWPSGEPLQLRTRASEPPFTSAVAEVLRETACRVESALAHLFMDSAGLRFLHADLHLGNLKLTPTGLAIFDFDDSLWGFPIQDTGISFFYLQHYPNYEELKVAFVEGYTSVRAWPQSASTNADADTFAAARMLELVSAMTNTDDPVLAGFLPRVLERGVPRLATWLERSS